MGEPWAISSELGVGCDLESEGDNLETKFKLVKGNSKSRSVIRRL